MVAFGDSVTQYAFDGLRQGWLAQLQHLYARRMDITARGFGGYNSRWAAVMMKKLFTAQSSSPAPALMTIFFGINDAVLPGEKQHVPLPEYRVNLHAIVTHLRSVFPGVSLVLITPAPVHIEKWSAHRGLQSRDCDRSSAHTLQYAVACKEVASEANLPVVDLHALLGAGDQSLAAVYLHDGLHLSSEGSTLLYAELQRVIASAYPQFDPESMRMQAPWHGDVEHHEIPMLALDRGDGLAGVRGLAELNLAEAVFEDLFQPAAQNRVVICDKNFHGLVGVHASACSGAS